MTCQLCLRAENLYGNIEPKLDVRDVVSANLLWMGNLESEANKDKESKKGVCMQAQMDFLSSKIFYDDEVIECSAYLEKYCV